ncbi:MAG: NADH:flavin oxidoreductase/NADH oxidase family protein [Oligoflexia bacterium]|nr:NADH:flavin oxidoreductase/NADH oxidase family protein [Oligoflexia bacterium]MBF0364725.1 NADH:flavin oxidoreductase/NADH oxidase family protein [Oligoflexia bacterium]
MQLKIEKTLQLECGIELKNRLGKAAMSENMADHNNLPAEEFLNAYASWSKGGASLVITGHVMIDRKHISEPHNVILDDEVSDLTAFQKWAQSGKANGTSLWMQINHPGKQIPKFINKAPVAPSAVAFPTPMNKLFNTPRALSEEEIWRIVSMFATTAKLAKGAGFDGVQIHGAHGYLVSQFLSPKHNKRSDQWGGSLENRMRFLLQIYHAIRSEVGKNFGVAVKLNSADFQRGGFSEEESLQVIQKLDQIGIDFIEISGGTYEAPVMVKGKKESTLAREAYFMEFTTKVKKVVKTPIMLTGGFRTKEGMEGALAANVTDIVGMGRPFAVYPDLVNKLLEDKSFKMQILPKKTGIAFIDAIVPLEITCYVQQIHRMGKKLAPKENASVCLSIIQTLLEMKRRR